MDMGGGRQTSKGFSKPCILLILIAGMERFAFKGVASNLVTYLTDVVKMSNSSAAKAVNSWVGFTSIMPLLVASFADSYWDQYSTILASSFLYVLGLVALTSTALVWASAPRSPDSSTSYLYWSLGLISVGLGGYNPSLQAFAADQIKAEDELPCTTDDSSSKRKKTLFFQSWYFGICSGSLLGVSLMSYIQDTIGWGLGFAIPAVAMVISIVFFACGSRFYAYKQDKLVENRPLESIVQAIKSSATKMMNYGITLQSKERDANELELEEIPLCHQGFDGVEGQDENPNSRIYLIENAKVILRLLPIWTMLLTFAIVFQQPATFFTKQGMTMKRNLGCNFKIPPATLQSAITVSIILLMPLYDKVLIPVTRIITRDEKGISVMQRMGIGMVLSIIAMAIAAIVESKRLQLISKMTVLDTQQGITVPLSIFWLLPQYILLGISDIFTVVGMQEFFYSEVPSRMRTMGIALYTSVFGVGSFMSVLLISLIETFTSSEGNNGWFSDDMREARLDKYYWILTLLSALSLLLYIVLCRFYRCRDSLDNESCK